MRPLLNARSATPSRRKGAYNLRLVRLAYSYFVHEVAELFGVHVNAVRRWPKAGLRTIDDRRPHLIHGTDLVEFLSARQRGRKHKCAADEMFCCRCRAPRRPVERRVVVDAVNARQIIIRGICEVCGVRMNRGGSMSKMGEIRRVFIVTAAASLGVTADPIVLCDLLQGD
jgi:hypothetical protein